MKRRDSARILALATLLTSWLAPAPSFGASFVNFETPTVHPLDLSPDSNILAAVNTADNRLLLFDVASGNPRAMGSVSVGLDPVSVRFRSNDEAWVVNQISDSVSVVDIPTGRVRATLQTDDEPADVVFAGRPQRAFVSCSQADTVLVFDPDDLDARPRRIAIGGEDPRSMAVSPDRKRVYVGIFESGNRSTVLAGGFEMSEQDNRPTVPRNVVSDPAGPYGGQNPPPNSGTEFSPAIGSNLPDPPPVSLIVKKEDSGRWMDDNQGDWTEFVSGSMAAGSRRVPGWDVLDRDIAVIDAKKLSVSYIEGLMNIVMAVGVNPATGRVSAVGTDATNEVRFEPVLNGRFLRVQIALADSNGASTSVVDLNPHLVYEGPRVAKSLRKRSIGDPRSIVWNAEGTRGYVAGMGSNNVVAVDREGQRLEGAAPIKVGTGPVGLALDDALGRLYVLNRFAASISVADVESGAEIDKIKFFDPTPRVIRKGRKFLYDTHATSGLGHVSCASCHVDARTDRLGWDLGAPDGDMKSNEDQNKTLIPGDTFADWHPMKGPMVTQTLQDIIGKEPHHWRGDRDGLEEFAEAFHGLLGDDKKLSEGKMRRFEKYLATIHFPPNPFRNFDNTLPRRIKLPGHYRSGRFGREGDPLPAGDPRRGLEIFRRGGTEGDGLVQCSTCHALPTGQGTPMARVVLAFVPIPKGPNGEEHQALIGEDASEQLGFKIPHLRNLYDKVGMETTRRASRAGFGYFHDGAIDSLARFVSAEVFDLDGDQDVADLVALMLAFSGSGFEERGLEPPGSPSLDAHAAVGRQTTVSDPAGSRRVIRDMVALAAAGDVDLVVKGLSGAEEMGWFYEAGADAFAPRGGGPTVGLNALLSGAAPGAELTFTVVPEGSGRRIGLGKFDSRRKKASRASGERRKRLESRELRRLERRP